MKTETQRFPKTKGFIVGMTSVVMMACSSSGAKTYKTAAEEEEGRAVTAAAAVEAKARDFVEVEFSAGSSTLTSAKKAEIDSAIDVAHRYGKLDEVLVLSWADQEYPSKSLKKLSKADRDLAERRNKEIQKYIKESRNVDVDLYNMAEEPSVLSKWFNTTDAQLKKSLVAAGLPTTADELQYPSKASHSVILVKTK